MFSWREDHTFFYKTRMTKLPVGSICRVGIDECQEASMCVRRETRDTGICRTVCHDEECPTGFQCTFTAVEGDFQSLCMPVLKSSKPGYKSEHKAMNFEIEDALILVFGVFSFFLLYHVLKACFGSPDNKQGKRQVKQGNDKIAFQPQVLYHTPGCPACTAQLAQYNQQSLARPPPYNPQPFNANNFCQV